MVRSIGADWVIDYTQEDFTKSGQRYDLILDSVGNHSLSACMRVLNHKGVYVAAGGPDGRWIGALDRSIKALVLSRFVSQNLVMVLARIRSKEDLTIMHDLKEAARVVGFVYLSTTVTAVFTECYVRSNLVVRGNAAENGSQDYGV